ncbi:MAG: ATP synthase F0 subunit A [Planctomycetota bacterium]|nr:MAG: ATP synthase F0 subunit A [Planctomycetota bacterium]
MASPILHIKDSYYFEVPAFMWRHNYTSRDEVPEFLREAHPHATPEEFNKALDGKILIPQLPGVKLKNLYQSDDWRAVSKFMVLELVAAAILAFVFIRLAGMIRTGERPKGKFWNLFESMLLFIRDEVARPAIGKHDADKFLPLLWTLFFFVLACNLLGLVPWAGSPTAAFGVTFALAVVTLMTGMACGVIKFGPVGYVMNQIPHMDLPFILAILLKPMIWAIEVLGLFIKHAVLAVRLLANMVAGHIVLLSIMGMAFSIEGALSPYWGITAPISVFGSTMISLLELFVAFLQAYVFVFLSSLFIGAAIHHH